MMQCFITPTGKDTGILFSLCQTTESGVISHQANIVHFPPLAFPVVRT